MPPTRKPERPNVFGSGPKADVVWNNKVHSRNFVPVDIPEYAQKALHEANKKPWITLTNHHFLGPGNTAEVHGNKNIPFDSDDRIARDHDNDYATAKTKEDIHKADRTAIKSFAKDAVVNKNWHSAVGAVGLGGKHLADLASNRILYPSISGKSLYGSRSSPYAPRR